MNIRRELACGLFLVLISERSRKETLAGYLHIATKIHNLNCMVFNFMWIRQLELVNAYLGFGKDFHNIPKRLGTEITDEGRKGRKGQIKNAVDICFAVERIS